MNGFRIVIIAAFVTWGSGLVALSAQNGSKAAPAAAPAGGQQARGKALYADRCGMCHMETLKGTNDTTPLTGPTFWKNWETYTASNLLDQIKATMPADAPGTLERQAYVDITAYILKFNEVPLAGELPTDADALKKVVIKMKDAK